MIPVEYSKSGDSIRFTENGFKQYWVKVSEIDIQIHISEYEDWDNKYALRFNAEDITPYGKNYLRINSLISISKL